jgi:hypothetical protein
MCSRCVDRDEISSDAMRMAEKLGTHQADGTLEKYSLRQRLADLDGKVIH